MLNARLKRLEGAHPNKSLKPLIEGLSDRMMLMRLDADRYAA
jgi:hypothetical protein